MVRNNKPHATNVVRLAPSRPYWLDKGETGQISFTLALNQGARVHSDAERSELLRQIEEHFEKIGLAGPFTLAFVKQEHGTDRTKGLLFLKAKQNCLQLTYQPGGNDTRFLYQIPLQNSQMAETVYQMLVKTKAETDEFESQDEGGRQPTSDNVVLPRQDDTSTVLVADNRFLEVDAGGQLMLVQFDASLGEDTPFDALKEHLLEKLSQYGSEGVFIVKRGESTKLLESTAVGLHFCHLQPGASGIGFWFRESTFAPWHKYALVAEPTFDLESFAAEVAARPEMSKVADVGGTVFADVKRMSFMDDFAENVQAQMRVLTAMADFMQSNHVQKVSASEQVRLFNEALSGHFSPVAIGKLMARWTEVGLLRRARPSKSATSYEYKFGLGAAPLLPEPFKGLAPKRVDLPVQNTLPTSEKKVVQPASVPVRASLSVTHNPIDAALAEIEQTEKKIADAKAALLAHIEAAAKIRQCNERLKELHAQIETLIAAGKAVEVEREEWVNKSLSQAQVEAIMATLRP